MTAERKIKILWLTNVVLPEYCSFFEIKRTYAGGWMTGLLERLRELDLFEIDLCFPIRDCGKIRDISAEGMAIHSLWVGNGERSLAEIRSDAESILKGATPDIVHIWGTEHVHSYAMNDACHALNIRMIIDLQGLNAHIGERYLNGISDHWTAYVGRNGKSIRDLRDETLRKAQREKLCLMEAQYVLGRTTWDRFYAIQANPMVHYYHCDRILRREFYTTSKRWDYNACKKHTIFVSQANSPFKGVHYLLKALPIVLAHFPDTEVRIGGEDIYIKQDSTGKRSAYGEYIISLIKEKGIENAITFTGRLNEEEIIDEYTNANIFCCCSVTENNSNSICEAMYLGTPVLSSFVGGLGDILEHNKTGMFYTYDDIYALAGFICEMFEKPEMLKLLSQHSRQVAKRRHDESRVISRMVEIYREVCKNSV